MDLRITRHLETFFQLLNRWPVKLEEQMEYHWAPYGLMLEVKDERLLMTSWLLENQVRDLKHWVEHWHPRAFMGVPQRLFIIKHKLMISCLCPKKCEGREWYKMIRLHQQFLSKVSRGGQF